jgi:hypothetical protein
MITKKEKRAINKAFRASDDSHLYPVFGRFSVAERAIRRARKLALYNGEFSSAYEYRLCLEEMASRIVNGPNI